ncbi:MAG: NCS2 family permease [Eubacteriales bacterium]|jgi:AGZA family xanthine/uracil permease-like MFS transporter
MEKYFHLSENGTTVRTEILAGLTTFLTMSYIIFVQPAALSGSMFGFQTGMDFGALTTATCLSSALACLVMGFVARYPIALAPGMGENFFFVFSVMPAAAAAGFANSWQVALGVVFVSGVLFFVIYLLGIREHIFNSISPSMKNAIAAGIGIFIAFIGLQNAGLIIKSSSSGVVLNAHFASPDLIIFFFGLFLSAILFARRVRGAILWGIAGAAVLAIVLKLALPLLPAAISGSKLVTESMLMTRFSLAHGIISAPPSLAPTFLKMDLVHALSIAMWPFIIVFLFMDVFDTIGTLVGVGEQAGFIKDNKLPRVRQAMLADQTGTVIGSLLGTSTVTSYIESSAGVEAGGRTGLTSISVAFFFLLALFFSPLVAMIGSYGVITAPALVMVGAMMMRNAAKIEWSEYSESIPAFLVLVGIPFSYSIGDGLALGFISYSVVNLLSGKAKRVSGLMYVLSAVLLLYFFLLRSQLG